MRSGSVSGCRSGFGLGSQLGSRLGSAPRAMVEAEAWAWARGLSLGREQELIRIKAHLLHLLLATVNGCCQKTAGAQHARCLAHRRSMVHNEHQPVLTDDHVKAPVLAVGTSGIRPEVHGHLGSCRR